MLKIVFWIKIYGFNYILYKFDLYNLRYFSLMFKRILKYKRNILCEKILELSIFRIN